MWLSSAAAAESLDAGYGALKIAIWRAAKLGKSNCKIKGRLYPFTFADGIGRGGKIVKIWIDERPTQRTLNAGRDDINNAERLPTTPMVCGPAPRLTPDDRPKAELKAEAIALYKEIAALNPRNLLKTYLTAAKLKLPRLNVTASTLYRWRRLFGEGGANALEDRRGRATAGRTLLSDRQQNDLLVQIRSNARLSVRQLHKEVLLQMDKRGEIQYAPILTGEIKPPFSFRVIQRFRDRFFAENPIETTLLLKGNTAARGRHLPAHGQRPVGLRGEILEVDSSPLDAIIEIDGKRERYDLLQVVETYSGRRVCSLVQKSNALALTRLLWTAFETFGLPKTIYTDNGRDYCSQRVGNLLRSLNIAQIKGRAYHGEDKPKVERGFRTLMGGKIAAAIGYIGPNVAAREVIEDQKTKKERRESAKLGKTTQDHVLSLDQMRDLIDASVKEWDLCAMYGRVAPIALWNADQTPIKKIEYQDYLVAACPRKVVKINKKGLILDKRTFSAPFLATLSGGVEIREDMDNYKQAYVYSLQGEFLGVAFDRAYKPVTEEEAREATKAFEKKLNAVNRALKRRNN
ncbi:MAG: DDE-type integrase/transposase/recombinase [Helicobacteraceae bacterium]|jgi:transposase-like protein|nr:DDE-type integrase/transposase/recombinase [Helicobacteraceae bacterium]